MLREMSFSEPRFCKLMLCPGKNHDPICNYRPLVITNPWLSHPELEQGFAECSDGFGRHFLTRCANCCGKQTQGTTMMEWLPVPWGLHINLHSLCNHQPRWCPALIKPLQEFLGLTEGCCLMVPAAKPQPLSCQSLTFNYPLKSAGI